MSIRTVTDVGRINTDLATVPGISREVESKFLNRFRRTAIIAAS